MKLKLKMIAVAAAMASLAGAAHADLTSGTTQNNGSFSLLAFNSVTLDWYIRDLGFNINTFLPTGVTTTVADNNQGVNSGVAATGDKTPQSGLVLDKTNTANFADAAFATWYSQQAVQADVRWMVGSYDIQSVSSTNNRRRMIISSTDPLDVAFNSNLDSFTGTGAWGGLFNFFNPGTLSKSGAGMTSAANNCFQGGCDLATVGQNASLYYHVRSAFTGSSSNLATSTTYANGPLPSNMALVNLAANGDFTYSLAPAAAVPLPAAVWMMGAGLVAVGGVVRRRRAAAAQA